MSRRFDMTAIRPSVRSAAPWLLPVFAGALLFALFGTVPARLDTAGSDDSAWSLPILPDRTTETAEAEAVWSQRHPWGGVSAAELAAEVEEATAPVPVAIVSAAGGHEAVFLLRGSPEIRIRAGESLPNGGRVEQVDALTVIWTDGDGRRHEQRLIEDQPPQAGADAAGN